MKKMNRIAALVLALIMCLGMLGTASAAPSDVQITEQGGTVYYTATGSTSNGPLRQNGAVVEMTKTVAGTEIENEFEITLQVKTTQDLQKIMTSSPDAAVMLVMDVSNSMDDCVHCGQEKGHRNHDGQTTSLWYCSGTSGDTYERGRYGLCRNCGKVFSAHNLVETTTADCSYRSRLQDAQEAAIEFIGKFASETGAEEGDKRMVAIVSFGSNARRELNWVDVCTDAGYAAAVAAIGSHKDDTGLDIAHGNTQNGGTNIEGGLMLAKNILKAGIADRGAIEDYSYLYTILLTDGKPTFYVSDGNSSSNTSSITGSVTNTQTGGQDTDKVDVEDVGDEAIGTARNPGIRSLTNLSKLYSICFGEGVWEDKPFSNWTGTNPAVSSSSTVGDWLTSFSSAAFNGQATGLFDSFNTIADMIAVGAKAWRVNDSMGTYITNEGVIAVDNAANNGTINNVADVDEETGAIAWNLLLSNYDDNITTITHNADGTFTGVMGYTYKYKISLDNLAEDHQAETPYDTNGSASLVYMVADEKGNWPTDESALKTGYFAEPAVKSLQGSLEFTKVDDQGNPLSGAEFTLTINEDGETWSTTSTSTNGKVSFTNIPSGHKYTLTETVTPDGYVSANPIDVSVDFGVTTASGFSGAAEAPTVINIRKVAEVTVTKTFEGLPEELWPDVTVTLTSGNKTFSTILNAANKWTDVIEVDAPGTYTVSEEPAVVEDWALIEKEHPAEVTVAIGEQKNIDLVNTYEKVVGNLTITKTFAGDGVDVPNDLSFTITGENYSNTVSYADFTNGSYTIVGLPVGTYTVTESGAEVTDYTLTTTYNGETAESAAVELTKDGAGVEIVNSYEQDLGNLVIAKEFGEDSAFNATNWPEGKTLSFSISGTDQTVTLPESDDTPWSAVVEGLPVGAYTVTEDESGAAIANYTLTVNNNGIEHTISKDSETTAVITNSYEKDVGSLTITKTFSGDPVDVPNDLSFTITGENYSNTVSYADFTDGSYTIDGLPVGEYTVTESNTSVDGYSVETTYSIGSTASIAKDSEATIAVNNEYTKIIGDLVITKTFEGDEVTAPENLSFTITAPDGSTTIVPYTDFENGSYTLSDLALGQYTVTESNALVTDYTLTTTYKVNGESANAGSVELTKNGATIEIINTYEQDLGDLIITKNFSGDPVDVPEGLSFTITGPYDYSATVAYTEFENGSYTIDGLPVGEYTVTESNTSVAGHSVVTTYTPSSTASIIKDGEATIAVNNEYTKIIGDLVVTKDVTGDLNEDDFASKSITFTVSGPDGYTGPASFTLPESDDTPWAWSVSNVPLGTYTITESGADVENYTLTTTYKVNGEAANAASVELTKAGAAIEIINTYKQDLGDLIITKTFSGDPVDVPEGLSFTVTGPHDYSATIAYADFNNGSSHTIEDLPVGVYTVTESNTSVSGHTVETTYPAGNTADVIKDGSATVAVNNEYTKIIGDLIVTKDVAGDLTEEDFDGKSITFTVSGPEGYTGPASFTLPESDDTPWAWSISDVPLGIYTIAESGADVNDYNLTTSFMVNGEAADTATVDLTKAGATIDITNTYSMKVGSLTITKRNIGTTPEEVTLTVTGPHEFSEEVVLNANSWTKTFENLPIGTYTVTEDKESANVTGYTLTVSGEGEVNVVENEPVSIVIKNSYSADDGALKLVKVIEQDQGDPQVDYIKLQVSGNQTNGGVFSEIYTLDDSNDWQATIDIPAGTYTVAEIEQVYADDYYTVITNWVNQNVTVLPGQTAISDSNTVTCTNTYTLGESASLTIPVRKTVKRSELSNTDPFGDRVYKFEMTISDAISPRGKVYPGEYEVTFNGVKITPVHGVYTFDLTVFGRGSEMGLLKITGNPADLRDKKITITELSQTESGYTPNNAWTYDETVYEGYTYESDDGFGVNLNRITDSEEEWDGETAEFINLYTYYTEPPKTGDNSQLGLWMALMVLSAAGFVFTMKRRRAQN